MSDLNGIVQTLVSSAARTASNNSGQLVLQIPPDEAVFILDQTAHSGTSPTLDVFLQTSHDSGTTWTDFAHFTQQTTTDQRQVLQWSEHNAANASKSPTISGDAALAAGTVINGPIVSSQLRVKWTIAGTTPSFTFSVWTIMARLH